MKLTTAYAGSADITDENVAATLNAILPDDLGKLFVPETIRPRQTKGLHKVVTWLKFDDMGVGEEGVFPSDNLIKALLGRNEELAAEGQELEELALVMVFDPASGLDQSLAKEAHENGIRVIDLLSGGDDMVFEDDTPADEPPWQDGETPGEAAAADAVQADRAEKPAAVLATPSPAEVVEKATAAGVAAAEAALASPASGGVTVTLNLSSEAIDSLAKAIVAQMSGVSTAETPGAGLATVTQLPQAAPPVGDTGSNKADPAGQPEGTVAYYYLDDPESPSYRPVRGRKREAEVRVFLKPEEVTDLKAKGLIK